MCSSDLTMSALTRVRDPDMAQIASLCARTFSRPTLPIASPVVCGTDIVLCDGWERTLGVARRVPNNGDWNGQQNNCLFLSISGALGKMTPGAMRAEMFAAYFDLPNDLRYPLSLGILADHSPEAIASLAPDEVVDLCRITICENGLLFGPLLEVWLTWSHAHGQLDQRLPEPCNFAGFQQHADGRALLGWAWEDPRGTDNVCSFCCDSAGSHFEALQPADPSSQVQRQVATAPIVLPVVPQRARPAADPP